MMQRKLIQQGPGSMTVYLPKKWIENHGLSKGDEVDISEVDGKVIISQKTQKVKSSVQFRIKEGSESYIRAKITAAYRSGYDKIVVEYEKETQKKLIEKLAQEKLIGFEITKHEPGRIIIESISEPDEGQFENIFQKLFLNIEELLNYTLNRFQNSSLPEESYEAIEDRITRYDNFCRRLLMKKRFDKKAVLIWAFLVQINHAQREIYLANRLIEKKLVLDRKSIDLIKECKEYILSIREAYFKKDSGLIAKSHISEKKLIYEEGYALLSKSKSKESLILHHIMASIRNCYQSTSALAGLLLEE